MQNEKSNYKKLINGFMTLGGIAGITALFATAPELATNMMAQKIGVYSSVIAGLGICGAMLTWATMEDKKNGFTLVNELKLMKQDFSDTISSLTKTFREEYPKTPEINDLETANLSRAKPKMR